MTDALDRRTVDRLEWCFVVLGAAMCLTRFGACFPIWADESFLVPSILTRDFAALLEPLPLRQVAPPLYLVLVKACTLVAGLSEWSLRAPSIVAALGSLLLFRSLARATLGRLESLIAIGFFSMSYWLVRYGAEVKPYAIDGLVSLVLLRLAVAWHADARRGPALLALALGSLVAFGLSFPSVFVGGGVAGFMAVSALMRGRHRLLLHAGLVGGCLVAGFAIVFILHTSKQPGDDAAWMRAYWGRAFPPLPSVTGTIRFLIEHASGELMPYPVGGKNGASAFTLLCVVAGTVVLFRTGRRRLLGLAVLVLLLAFLAGALERYPFGAPTRCQFYLAPLFCLAAGAGLHAILAWRVEAPVRRRRVIVAWAVFVLVGMATIVRDVVHPAKTLTDRLHRDFARDVWESRRREGHQVLCLREDLGVSFTRGLDEDNSCLWTYVTNFLLYREPLAPLDPGRPVEVVAFRINGIPREVQRDRWIQRFEREHGLEYVESTLHVIPVTHGHTVDDSDRADVIEFMRFVPGTEKRSTTSAP